MGLAWFLVFVSCNDLIVGPDPANSPVRNFELLWRDFDAHYSLFDYKKIDWDSLYVVNRALVNHATPNSQLANVMKNLLRPLNDGHVYLITEDERFVSNNERQSGRPDNFVFENVYTTYFARNMSTRGDGRYYYGRLQDSIGYLYIPTFEDKDYARIDQWVSELDKVLADLNGVTGLIIDLRNNGGGDAFNSVAVAGRFADRRRLFAYGYSRNGRRHNDFSSPYAWYVEPTGKRQFLGAIVVLTNKKTASAAERFVLSMRVLPHTTVIGDTTEGAFPHSLARELPNGWSYRVTVGVVVDHNHLTYEGVGIPPGISIGILSTDLSQKRDTILETALEYLTHAAINNKSR
ncbi:MAG: S41 family peptidase [Bacteroidetes bacterium]|nr:S41 family peptidase [Bacteroidota bacterium]